MNYKRVKLACYSANTSMSIVANLSPLLFITFRENYGLSYSLLGLLVVINFVTQLTIDLVFSFFSHKFNIPLAVKMTPALSVVGLIVYALSPFIFPNNVFAGLTVGTVIFSASSGFAEVLVSPVISAIPSKDPDKEMSRLHSVYAWGVVFTVIFSTLFLLVFGKNSWQWLTLILAVVPLISVFLFAGADIPEMETPEKLSGALSKLKDKTLLIFVLSIFLGGAAECTMSQWASGYLEQALGIPKVYGDVFGVALFGATLGIGRTLYAGFGKNIEKILLLGSIGATLCYFTAALSPFSVVGLLACAFTGLCTSMLWPGNLISASERIPHGGVFLYALMAAGGDLGASVAPQLVGVITDISISSGKIISLSGTLGLTPEQLGMKIGMLVGMLFPLCAIPVCCYLKKSAKTEKGL